MSGNWQHSELLPSQENKLVLKILKLGYVDFPVFAIFDLFLGSGGGNLVQICLAVYSGFGIIF